MPVSPEKTPVRMMRFADLEFAPRFEHGDTSQVAELCGTDDATQLGVGWARLSKARIFWTIRYDEVVAVYQGQLKLHTEGKTHQLSELDSIRLPGGTQLVHEAEHALIQYASICDPSRELGFGLVMR
ncbi:MAG: ethanolamine utilization protein EutQ [Gammaproteobacteria bacterium]|nr:ethanolamine utilization protein EutQ [Gammaproteobacteria bacterium]